MHSAAHAPPHSRSGAANFAASCAALAAMLRAFSSDWSWQQSVAVAAALCAGNRHVNRTCFVAPFNIQMPHCASSSQTFLYPYCPPAPPSHPSIPSPFHSQRIMDLPVSHLRPSLSPLFIALPLPRPPCRFHSLARPRCRPSERRPSGRRHRQSGFLHKPQHGRELLLEPLHRRPDRMCICHVSSCSLTLHSHMRFRVNADRVRCVRPPPRSLTTNSSPIILMLLLPRSRFVTFYISEEGLCRASGVVAAMATCYIIHNRHASPLLLSSRPIVTATFESFAFVSSSIVTAAAGSSLAFFWKFSQMSPAAVRPVDWGNVIALALVLLIFRAIFLYVHCAAAIHLNPSATHSPSPLEFVIATLASSTSPLTTAFGLIICSSSTRCICCSAAFCPHPSPFPFFYHISPLPLPPCPLHQSCCCPLSLFLLTRPRDDLCRRIHRPYSAVCSWYRVIIIAISSPPLDVA